MSPSLFATTAASSVCVYLVFLRTYSLLSGKMERRKALSSLIRTMGAVLWPLLLLSLIPQQDRCSSVLIVPILWNSLMWVLDSYLLHNSPSSQKDRPASVRIDPSPLAGLTFGFCSLVGSRPDSKYAHLFLYAILVCLVFVFPSHNLSPDCIEEQIVESVQKTALMWCIGLILSAVLLTRRASSCES